MFYTIFRFLRELVLFEIVLNRKILFILFISVNTTFVQSQYNFEMGFSVGASNH